MSANHLLASRLENVAVAAPTAMSSRWLVLFVFLAVALAPAAEALAAGQWWAEAWTYRRPITVNETPTKLPGDDVAVFEMSTAGLVLKDGGDIRVVTPEGRELPTRVLMLGPGDRVLVAFALAGGGRYFVYFGNARPAAPAKELDLRRGVLQETWAYVEGGIKGLDAAKKTIASSKDFIGRDFRPRIFQGHNPFGPQNKLASVFTAHFVAPQKGQYVFATSSQDASFLVIDDTLVVDNGSHHKPQGDVSQQGKIDLEQGLHRMVLLHISTGGGDPIVAAAWKPPDAGAIKPMPPEAFAPVAQASAGVLEQYAKEITIDFWPVHAGESFVAERYFQRFVFDAQASGPARGTTWQWDFGDGQKSSAGKVEHVYLTNGEFRVTLTAKTPSGTLARTNRVFVSRPWDTVTENKLDQTAMQGKIVAGYDFRTLPAEALVEAIVLLERAKEAKALVQAGDALVQLDVAPGKQIEEAMGLYVQALVSAGEQPKAVAALTKASKMTRDPAVSAGLLVSAGQLAIGQADAAKAQELFETVVKQYSRLTTSPAIRAAQIGLGDSYRLKGDYDKAREAYASVKVKVDETGGSPVAKGDYARHVEDYLRQKQLDWAKQYLEKWGDDIPLDRLEGYWSLMRCRYFQAAGSHADAAAEAQVLVKVNPTSAYAPELLMLAADSYEKLRQADQAKACLQMVADKYKESPLSLDAAKRLKQ